MARKSSKRSQKPVYGFGESGIMSKEYFPYFMAFYCIAFFLAILIILWKLKGYNKKEKRLREALESNDLRDEDATFVPPPSIKKQKEKSRTDAKRREGRTMIRKATTKLLEKRAREAKQRAKMIIETTTTEEDSDYTEEELYVDRNGRIKED